MRFALYSDLHREVKAWEPPALDVDLVILAGDISSHTRGLTWAAATFQQPVIYVAGNHEYYGASFGLLAQLQKPVQPHVHFLERNTFELAGTPGVLPSGRVRFLGCTLWSSFDLHGAGAQQALAMTTARLNINDYWMIRGHDGKTLEPRETLSIYRKSVAWLDAELSKPFDGKTVVVTHFAPHRGCVAPQHEGSDVSPYFVTDLSRLMEKHRIDVWCHGHTHTNNDFVAEGGCRVVSNQLGYPGERVSGGFRNDLVIEL